MGAMLEITQTARLENLAALRNFVANACQQTGVDEAVCFQLTLAVDEICANIVEHGYTGRPAGPITLSFQHDGQQVKITIRDQGQPFDPCQAPLPDLDAGWEERSIGGLGLYLVLATMDEVGYSSDPERGNCLRLVKRIEDGATQRVPGPFHEGR